MFHPAAGGARGPVPNMLSLLNTIDRYVNKMELNVCKRSGMTEADYQRRVIRDFWVDAEDAKALNLVDELVILDVSGLQQPEAEVYLKRQKQSTTGITTIPDVWMQWTF
jgi:ATP-dependent protease ClpP protease subunit